MNTDKRRRIKILSVLLCVHLWFNSPPSQAQIDPPLVRSSHPVAVIPGESVTLGIRGRNLEAASALLFEDARLKAVEINAAEDKVQAKLTLPDDLAPGPIRYRVVTAHGLSNLGALWVGRALPVVAEAEPNNGFR